MLLGTITAPRCLSWSCLRVALSIREECLNFEADTNYGEYGEQLLLSRLPELDIQLGDQSSRTGDGPDTAVRAPNAGFRHRHGDEHSQDPGRDAGIQAHDIGEIPELRIRHPRR